MKGVAIITLIPFPPCFNRAAQAKFKAQETKWEQLKAEQQKQILALKHKDTNYLVPIISPSPSQASECLCFFFQHEMRKREGEYNRLKERLRAVADNKKETSAIAISSSAPKATSSSRTTMAVCCLILFFSFSFLIHLSKSTDIMVARYENKIQSLSLENQSLRYSAQSSFKKKKIIMMLIKHSQ